MMTNVIKGKYYVLKICYCSGHALLYKNYVINAIEICKYDVTMRQ